MLEYSSLENVLLSSTLLSWFSTSSKKTLDSITALLSFILGPVVSSPTSLTSDKFSSFASIESSCITETLEFNKIFLSYTFIKFTNRFFYLI